MSDLRSDLIDRARKMSRIRNMNHPWLTMGDEALLRSAGLILRLFHFGTNNFER